MKRTVWVLAAAIVTTTALTSSADAHERRGMDKFNSFMKMIITGKSDASAGRDRGNRSAVRGYRNDDDDDGNRRSSRFSRNDNDDDGGSRGGGGRSGAGSGGDSDDNDD